MKSPGYALALFGTLLPVLALMGCQNPKTVAAQDAVYCEKQGFPPGTDGNFDCALQRGEERAASGAPEGPDPILTPTPVGSPPPPKRKGGVHQTLEVKTVTGITTTVFFAYALNDDCTVNTPPAIKLTRQPTFGEVQIVPHVGYVTPAGLHDAPVACIDKKVSGQLLEYTPNSNTVGVDALGFQLLRKNGEVSVYRAYITVTKPVSSNPAVSDQDAEDE
jgi:hypothetical protein